MINELIELLLSTKGDAVMAWVQFLPAAMGVLQTGYGMIQEGRKRAEAKREREKWNRENEAWYNKEYNSDYTKRADVQNVIRQMRDEFKLQGDIDKGLQTVTGGTNEMELAQRDRRNRAMANLFGNLAAQGARHKDNVDREYRNRKYALQGLTHDEMNQEAQSANNLAYNGLKTLGGTDWASIMKGFGGNTQAPAAQTDMGKVIDYDYTEPTGNSNPLDINKNSLA